MPAAAVILVPIVCMMIDAVKKSVVYILISIVRYIVWLRREMKCDNPNWMNRSESYILKCIIRTRT